jgi:hypothetical protein
MRRAAALLAALVAVLVLAATAFAGTTADSSFQSSGKAVQPGAVLGLGTDGTYEDFPFTIAPGDQDGSATIFVQWSNAADDFDLYVYRKLADGSLETVASSAQGNTTSEQAVIQAQGDPVRPGDYIARVQNYAATSPQFSGTIKFSAYTPPNVRPTAALTATPATPTTKTAVTLDASGSKDADGGIGSYAWDIDGDGQTDLDTGTKPTLRRHFTAGTHHVTVRVTDDKGARAYANATFKVTKAPKKKKKH